MIFFLKVAIVSEGLQFCPCKKLLELWFCEFYFWLFYSFSFCRYVSACVENYFVLLFSQQLVSELRNMIKWKRKSNKKYWSREEEYKRVLILPIWLIIIIIMIVLKMKLKTKWRDVRLWLEEGFVGSNNIFIQVLPQLVGKK